MRPDDPMLALPVIRALSSAVTTRAMYPASHPRFLQGVKFLEQSVHSCLRERQREEITFLIIDNEILVDDRPVRARALHMAPLVRTMNRLAVERLTLANGVKIEEILSLIDGLAGLAELKTTNHVVLGRVHLGEVGDALAEGDLLPRLATTELSEAVVDELNDSYLAFSSDRAGSVARLDQMLWNFVEGMDQSARSLLMLAPLKSYQQWLFAHSINVGLLVLAQARALGIEGEALHDIGLAALLHDIGKLSLPRWLTTKRHRYTEDEWEVVKLHPELGAAQLCGVEGVPPVAILVAYEHHLRWDGKPSFPLPSTPREPNLASQLTAIADTYDAMIASRGLSDGVHGEAARKVWMQRSETYLDPFLVGNFVFLVIGAEQGD